MANALSGIRQKLQQITESGRAVKRLTDTGIIDLRDLNSTIQAAKLTRAYGPQATMTILGGRRYPTLPAIVDERGTLDVSRRSTTSPGRWRMACNLWASPRAPSSGYCAAIIVAWSSRWPRAASSAARLVLMNTGFAKPQFARSL